MKKLSLIVLFVLTINSFKAQTTAIPDPNFEQALINLGYDIGPIDGIVTTSNINSIINLSIANKNISDITGIEDFTSLEVISCQENLLTNLDFSQNLNLEIIHCWENNLTSLNVTQNTNLTELSCGTNSLPNIDVTNNTMLIRLYCWKNQLSSLNLSQNLLLTHLNAYENNFIELNLSHNSQLISISVRNNQLTCLNLKNGNNINSQVGTGFFAINNPNLLCIEVDNVAWANSNWALGKDNWAIFSTNCPNPCAVGINEVESNEILISPNPTLENISVNLNEKLKSLISIYNIAGKRIFNKHYNSNELIEINLDAPNGLYFVKVETDKGIFTEKIIKQ